MTWFYVPGSTSSASAPEDWASTWALNSPAQALAQSAWWKGKPSQLRDWLRRCAKVPWLQRLCGRMSEPSMADHGVALWMASLAESRASRTPWLDQGKDPTTNATSGATPVGSLCRPGHGSCSSRTSLGCSQPSPVRFRARPVSDETYQDWVTRLRRDSSARESAASRRSASASSFSRWPTPDPSAANDQEDPETWTARGEKQRELGNSPFSPPLAMAAKMWRVPLASEAKRGTAEGWEPKDLAGEHSLSMQAGRSPTPTASDSKGSDTIGRRPDCDDRLATRAARWSTPRATDGDKGGPNMEFSAGGTPLPSQAAKWPAAMVVDGEKGQIGYMRRGQLVPGLSMAASRWPGPQARDDKGVRRSSELDHNSRPLNEVAAFWSAPTVACSTGGQATRGGERSEELLLTGQARQLCSLLDPTTSETGQESLSEIQTSPRRSLNPIFVRGLMGWPGRTAFDFAETERCRWWQDMRSELLLLGTPPPEAPVQPSLFGG